jgi:hypothetical protein
VRSMSAASEVGRPAGGRRFRRSRWLVVGLLAIAYSVWMFSTHDLPTRAFYGGDSWEYQSMGVNLATGHGFMKSGAVEPFERYVFDAPQDTLPQFAELGRNGGTDDFYRTPAYPVFLAAVYSVVSVRPDVAMGVQLALLIAVAAALPLLTERLLGRSGFLAGILGGALLLRYSASSALEILTEPLTTVACFLVLAAWSRLCDRPRDPVSAGLLGLSLAFALLTKGSLLFLPPLLIGYLVVRAARRKAFTWTVVAAVTVSLFVPVVAYSAYASARVGRPVFLSTQGPAVLLDGNNELSIENGGWQPGWRDNPRSFYSRALSVDPAASPYVLVARFYASNVAVIPRIAYNKMRSAIGRFVTPVFAASLLLLAFTLGVALSSSQGERTWRRVLVSGFALALAGYAAIASASADVPRDGLLAACVVAWLLAGATALRARGYRLRIRSLWERPETAGMVLFALNFLLLTLATFGEARFLKPGFLLFGSVGAFMFVRVAESAELPLYVAFALPGEGPTDSLKLCYDHTREVIVERTADEVSSFARYFGRVAYTSPDERTLLLDRLPSASTSRIGDPSVHRRGPSDDVSHLVVLDGTLNHSVDIQGLLTGLGRGLQRGDRVAAVLYNPYLRGIYAAADALGLRDHGAPTTFITRVDLHDLARISGYEVVSLRPVAIVPLDLLGIGRWFDGALRAMPGLRWLSPVSVAMLRPVRVSEQAPSLSIVVPARNERGNIEAALARLPEMSGVDVEVIFVEGHSSDGTWEEIERVLRDYRGPARVLGMRQTGVGKADAVWLGFSKATGQVLTILDADLTMPPEDLVRFYNAYREGLGDFCNGSRLVYPMEGHAMRFLNRLGNVFFSKALSSVLEVRLGDTLCGTKLFSRGDHERMVAWRRDFGDFDPFGDFEMLFPAATLGLGIVDIPISYRARTYGSTNISRFRHGLKLAKMTAVGLVRVRMGLTAPGRGRPSADEEPAGVAAR